MPVWQRIYAQPKQAKRKGEGRKPKYEGKTKQQARAEIIAKRAERENGNG